MAETTIVNLDAMLYSCKSDLIFTDPPFDIGGDELNNIINNYQSNHVVLISTMKQLLEFNSVTKYDFCFDFILNAVVPKKSKSINMPNYTHNVCAYFKIKKSKSIFNRKKKRRSDVFESNGYWPTIIQSERNRLHSASYAKNITAITDIIGSFECESVIDMFAGSGTTAIACDELNINCTLIEKDNETFENMKDNLKINGIKYKEIGNCC